CAGRGAPREPAPRLVVWEEGVCVICERHDAADTEAEREDEAGGGDADARDGEENDASRSAPAPIRLAPPAAAAPARILTVLARYGADQYARAERDIDDIFARQMPHVERTVVVVDNALPPGHVERREQGALVGRAHP